MSCNLELVAVINMLIYRGDTYEHTFTWLDQDDNPIDLTNYTARMNVIKNAKSTATPLLELVSPTQLELGADGTIKVNISSTESLIYNVRSLYDLEMTNTETGRVTTIVQGEFTTEKDKTV